MPDIDVSIGQNSIISASSANSINISNENNDFAFSLSRTLHYIYTAVKNSINNKAMSGETSIRYDIFDIYGANLTAYEFKNFLSSRGYSVSFKKNDGVTNVTGTYSNDADIKANLYSSTNPDGIRYINIDWSSSSSSVSNYVITIS